jgi:D-alanyl-D-alanine carboxypeptidase
MRTLFAAVILLHQSLTAGLHEFPAQTQAQLQQRLEASMALSGTLGVAVAVRRDGLEWVSAAGFSTLDSPAQTTMAWGIGSITKLLAATCTMRAVEDGILSLDETVESRIGELPNVSADVTIRQLLTHTSGLGDYSESQQYRSIVATHPDTVWSLTDLVRLIPSPQSAPGSGFRYSNTNYLLVAVVLEHVYNEPFAAIMRRLILEPTRAQSSWMGGTEPARTHVATRWIGDRSGEDIPYAAVMSGASAAGGMMSTAEDLVSMIDAISRGMVIQQATLDSMLPKAGASYGLGTVNLAHFGEGAFGHTGSIRGYTSIALHVPSLGATVVVLCNRSTADPRVIAQELLYVVANMTVSVSAHRTPPRASDAPYLDGEFVRVFDVLGREYQPRMLTPHGSMEAAGLPWGYYMLGGVTGWRTVWFDGARVATQP